VQSSAERSQSACESIAKCSSKVLQSSWRKEASFKSAADLAPAVTPEFYLLSSTSSEFFAPVSGTSLGRRPCFYLLFFFSSSLFAFSMPFLLLKIAPVFFSSSLFFFGTTEMLPLYYYSCITTP